MIKSKEPIKPKEEFPTQSSDDLFTTLLKVGDDNYPWDLEIKMSNYDLNTIYIDEEGSSIICYKGMPIVSNIYSNEGKALIEGIPYKEDFRHISVSEYIDSKYTPYDFVNFTRIHFSNLLMINRGVQEWSSNDVTNPILFDFGHSNQHEGLTPGEFVLVFNQDTPIWCMITKEAHNNNSPYIGLVVSVQQGIIADTEVQKGDFIYIFNRAIKEVSDE